MIRVVKNHMYYVLGLSILTASFNSIVLNKAGVSKKETVFKFNFLCSLVWCVILFFTNNCTLHLNSQIVLWGVLYGTAQICFLLSKTGAMSTGSVSVTTLIGNSSLLISVFVSMSLWKETVTFVDITGLLILCISIFLCTYKKAESGYKKSWKYFIILFFVFAASVGIIFKAFGKAGNLSYCGDMMLFSAIIMTITSFIISLFVKASSAKNQNTEAKRKFLIYAFASGVLSCLYNRLNIFLASSIDGIIFFPAFNGGVTLLSTLLSVIFLKEKLLLPQKIGLIAGTVSICIIGIL